MGDSYYDFECEAALHMAQLDDYLERPYWRTREGQELWIDEMESSHIRNCIAMIERKAPAQARKYALALDALRSELRQRDAQVRRAALLKNHTMEAPHDQR